MITMDNLVCRVEAALEELLYQLRPPARYWLLSHFDGAPMQDEAGLCVCSVWSCLGRAEWATAICHMCLIWSCLRVSPVCLSPPPHVLVFEPLEALMQAEAV